MCIFTTLLYLIELLHCTKFSLNFLTVQFCYISHCHTTAGSLVTLCIDYFIPLIIPANGERLGWFVWLLLFVFFVCAFFFFFLFLQAVLNTKWTAMGHVPGKRNSWALHFVFCLWRKEKEYSSPRANKHEIKDGIEGKRQRISGIDSQETIGDKPTEVN